MEKFVACIIEKSVWPNDAIVSSCKYQFIKGSGRKKKEKSVTQGHLLTLNFKVVVS